MEEFTRKIMMHIEALVSFCTTIHKVELAQFHFSRWQRVMRKRTIFSSMTLSLHVIYADCVYILPVVIVLWTTTISIISNLTPGLVLTTFVFATATSYYKKIKSNPTVTIEQINYNLSNVNNTIMIKEIIL